MNNEFDLEFKKLVKDDGLPISSVEELMIKDMEKYQEKLNRHVEELLQKEVDEGNLIIKKNKSGKIVAINYVTKEKKK